MHPHRATVAELTRLLDRDHGIPEHVPTRLVHVVAGPELQVDGVRREPGHAQVVQVAGGFADTVGARDQLPGGVVLVGDRSAVEVRFPDQVPRSVVVVASHRAEFVGDADQAAFGVITELQARAVRSDFRRRQVEMCHLGVGFLPQGST